MEETRRYISWAKNAVKGGKWSPQQEFKSLKRFITSVKLGIKSGKRERTSRPPQVRYIGRSEKKGPDRKFRACFNVLLTGDCRNTACGLGHWKGLEKVEGFKLPFEG